MKNEFVKRSGTSPPKNLVKRSVAGALLTEASAAPVNSQRGTEGKAKSILDGAKEKVQPAQIQDSQSRIACLAYQIQDSMPT